jgi:hypothetical protein
MNRHRAWFPATVALVGLAAAVGAARDARADFKMLQNLNTGRVTAGNRVECNDPNGFTHWNTRAISIYHNTANQGAGKAAALQASMQAWTNVSGASYMLSYAGTTSAGFVTDGKSTLVWVTNGGCTGSCLGLTALVLQSGQVIVESDVIFNNGVTWTTNGNNYDTQSVATHELGHLLGIHHPNTVSGPQTMSTPYFGTAMRSLDTDDIAALQCSENRYPPPCSGTPAVPASLNVYRGYCYGNNDVTWSPSCTGAVYELYGSTSSNFTTQFLEYSGTGLTKHVTVSQQTYYRVRACNGGSCSGYRVGDQSALYWSGCY